MMEWNELSRQTLIEQRYSRIPRLSPANPKRANSIEEFVRLENMTEQSVYSVIDLRDQVIEHAATRGIKIKKWNHAHILGEEYTLQRTIPTPSRSVSSLGRIHSLQKLPKINSSSFSPSPPFRSESVQSGYFRKRNYKPRPAPTTTILGKLGNDLSDPLHQQKLVKMQRLKEYGEKIRMMPIPKAKQQMKQWAGNRDLEQIEKAKEARGRMLEYAMGLPKPRIKVVEKLPPINGNENKIAEMMQRHEEAAYEIERIKRQFRLMA